MHAFKWRAIEQKSHSWTRENEHWTLTNALKQVEYLYVSSTHHTVDEDENRSNRNGRICV